jgi:hypothetical protein
MQGPKHARVLPQTWGCPNSTLYKVTTVTAGVGPVVTMVDVT